MSWYSPSWTYRVSITIDNTKVGADHTDFPVLLTEDNMPAHLWSTAKADGSDLVLTASDGKTKLKRELVTFTPGTPHMELWVKVPSLAGSVDTVIYLYYGNAVGAETNDTDTWNANYMGVYHFNEASGYLQDSTSRGKHMDYEDGNITKGSVAQTLWGDTSWYFNIGRQQCSTFLDTFHDFTVTVWEYHTNTTDSFERLVDKQYSTGFWFGRDTSTQDFGGGVLEPAPPYGVFVTPVHSTWHQLVSRRGGTDHYVIRDGGAESANNVVSGSALAALPLGIGGWGDRAATQQRATQIYFEEVRITDNALPDEWILTEYNNTFNPSTFYSVGTPGASPYGHDLTVVVETTDLQLEVRR